MQMGTSVDVAEQIRGNSSIKSSYRIRTAATLLKIWAPISTETNSSTSTHWTRGGYKVHQIPHKILSSVSDK